MSDLERPDFDCPIDNPGCGECLMCKSFHGYPLDEPIPYVPTPMACAYLDLSRNIESNDEFAERKGPFGPECFGGSDFD